MADGLCRSIPGLDAVNAEAYYSHHFVGDWLCHPFHPWNFTASGFARY